MVLQGTLRVLLVLLHDLPEFLCEFHFELVSHVPTSCVQMRNLILSAFPRTMRLPDPFTPNLKVPHPAKQLLPHIHCLHALCACRQPEPLLHNRAQAARQKVAARACSKAQCPFTLHACTQPS